MAGEMVKMVETSLIYQIYPRSLKDSDGDGIREQVNHRKTGLLWELR